MNRQGLLLFLLLSLFAVSVQAQYNAAQSKVWVFGQQAGLNFNTGSPIPIHTSIAPVSGPQLEGCASVSDENGYLLFYCTGNRVWDRSNTVMLHGGNILSPAIHTDSTTQGVVITPMPGNKNRYYIFSLQQATSPPAAKQCRLYYSVVDMSLNGGYGDVVTGLSGKLLDSNLSEAMTTVPGDYCDAWVLVHGIGNHVFRSYHVTNMGISAPVLSNTGNFSGSNSYISGMMKVSPNRHKLVVTTNENGGPMSMGAELCDFSAATGNVSNAVVVDTGLANHGVYSAAFSADNTKLYLHTSNISTATNTLLQFDLSLPVSTIITSRYVVRLRHKVSDLKLGPDDKIYLNSDDSSTALDCIAVPGQGGPACQYVRSAVILPPGTTASVGLPNEYASVAPTDTLHSLKDTTICPTSINNMVLHAPEGFNHYSWSNASHSDTLKITDTGTYRVTSNTFCDVRVDSFRIHFSHIDTVRNKITANICTPNNTTLLAPIGYQQYTWSDGSEGSSYIINLPGIYWLYSVKDCGVRVDSFMMQNQVDLSFSLGPDTVICSNMVLSVDLQDVSCRWQDGNKNHNYLVDHSGEYYVTVSKQGCSYTDTIHVIYANISQDMHDVVLCNDAPINIDLQANIPEGAVASWSDGSNGKSLRVTQGGTYWITVTAGGCKESDTVQVSSGYCDCIISIPSAFSPNGDSKNDKFKALIQPGCELYSFQLTIFNRWGDRVFTTKNSWEAWDGLYKGLQASADTYMYVVEYTGGIKGSKHKITGDVTLVR